MGGAYIASHLSLRITITGIGAHVVIQCEISLESHERMNGDAERNVPN